MASKNPDDTKAKKDFQPCPANLEIKDGIFSEKSKYEWFPTKSPGDKDVNDSKEKWVEMLVDGLYSPKGGDVDNELQQYLSSDVVKMPAVHPYETLERDHKSFR